METRPFRFGVVAGQAGSGREWAERARRVEALGFSTLLVPDTLGATLPPLVALAFAAAATTRLRVGTYVLANDYRNPVLVARDAAAIDFLSGGRFELGLGVGRPGAEEDSRRLGVPFDPGSVRVSRLAESLAIVKDLLEGRRVEAPSRHYAPAGAEVFPRPVQQPRPPILVAATGRRLLQLAGREADIIAIGVTAEHDADAVEARVGWVREAAGPRFNQLELNLNLLAAGQQPDPRMISWLRVDLAELERRGSPLVLMGDREAMCEQLLARRERLGVSYWNVGVQFADAMGPVVERLAGR